MVFLSLVLSVFATIPIFEDITGKVLYYMVSNEQAQPRCQPSPLYIVTLAQWNVTCRQFHLTHHVSNCLMHAEYVSLCSLYSMTFMTFICFDLVLLR